MSEDVNFFLLLDLLFSITFFSSFTSGPPCYNEILAVYCVLSDCANYRSSVAILISFASVIGVRVIASNFLLSSLLYAFFSFSFLLLLCPPFFYFQLILLSFRKSNSCSGIM